MRYVPRIASRTKFIQLMHVHLDYPPPRSWDQFEELCADAFQSKWSDPSLVRHGRSGQRQHGVDIVGRNGSTYPIGLQCKRKSRWPVAKLSKADVDREVKLACNFKPALQAFYILTTAPDDSSLLAHVRAINVKHKASGLFEVVLLGWAEIVRLVTLSPAVADKHFGPSGGAHRSPLIGSWYLSAGKFQKPQAELHLDFQDLVQDYRDWPDGRAVFRQKESDALLDEIAKFGDRPKSQEDRKHRIELREKLHRLQQTEAFASQAVKIMLTDPELQIWLASVWPREQAAVCVQSLVDEFFGKNSGNGQDVQHLRLTPPGQSSHRFSARLDEEAVDAILKIRDWREKKYGKALTDTVDELPEMVRSTVAIPRIIRGVVEVLREEFKTVDQLKELGWFRLGHWKIEMA